MPYRDQLEALAARVACLEEENARLRAALRGEASPPPPSSEGDARPCSVRGGEPTTIAIRNASHRKLRVSWLSYEGLDRAQGTLVPGGAIRVETYVGFCWRFDDADGGEVLAHVRVEAPAQEIVYEE